MDNIIHGCRDCKWRNSELYEGKDINNEIILRCRCTARHAEVDVDLMTKTCQWYKFSETKGLLIDKNPDEIV
jgi:hypothetical protein